MKKYELVSYLDGYDVTSLMKSNTIFKSFFPYFLFVILFFKLNTLQAQIQNNSDLYIGDNSLFYVGVENFIFSSAVAKKTTIKTSRTKLNYGVLSFPIGAWCSGASENAFVDGYAQTLSHEAFILPIGQSGIYAPIQIIPSNTGGVDAAYFRATPNSIGGALDTSISSISSVEYWDIKSNGVNAGISLSWRPSSAISDLTSSSLSNLTIVGWNGSTWVTIPSIVDEDSILGAISDLDSGSISTNAKVDLSAFSAFSVGAKTKQSLVTEFNKVELTVYVNKNTLFIEASQPIKTLIVHDVTGKLVLIKNLNGDFKYSQPFNYEFGMYIVTTELYNVNSLIKKKIINNSY